MTPSRAMEGEEGEKGDEPLTKRGGLDQETDQEELRLDQKGQLTKMAGLHRERYLGVREVQAQGWKI